MGCRRANSLALLANQGGYVWGSASENLRGTPGLSNYFTECSFIIINMTSGPSYENKKY